MIHIVRDHLNIEGDRIIADEEDQRYLVKIRRIRNGEAVCFAAKGTVCETKAEICGKDIALIISNKYSRIQTGPKIYAAIAAGDINALEESVRNGVEAGADAFFIFRSDYSNTDVCQLKKKTERLKSIIASAASQSRRSFLPEIIFSTMEELISMECEHIAFHPYSSANIMDLKPSGKDKMLWIGAEGGFSERETELFKAKNFTFLSLKTPILRMENAATVALAFVRNLTGYAGTGDKK